jgi:hypothetical protein
MIKAHPGKDNAGTIITLHLEITEESLVSFRRMLARALNTWDNAPGELKELSDMLEHGKILQEYKP